MKKNPMAKKHITTMVAGGLMAVALSASAQAGHHEKGCNPCAAKAHAGCGANPCAAKNPCNPCAAANPCAAKKGCNPCAAKNPCAAE